MWSLKLSNLLYLSWQIWHWLILHVTCSVSVSLLTGSNIQLVQLLYSSWQDQTWASFNLASFCILHDRINMDMDKVQPCTFILTDWIWHWRVSTCPTLVYFLTGSDNGRFQLVQLLYRSDRIWQWKVLTCPTPVSFMTGSNMDKFQLVQLLYPSCQDQTWASFNCPAPVSLLIGSDNDRFQLVQFLYLVSKRHLCRGRHKTRTSHLECKVRLFFLS